MEKYNILSKKEIIKAIKNEQIDFSQEDVFNELRPHISKIEKVTKKEIKYKCIYDKEDDLFTILSFNVQMPNTLKDKLELMKIIIDMWFCGHRCSEKHTFEVDENGKLRKFNWSKDKEFDISFEP